MTESNVAKIVLLLTHEDAESLASILRLIQSPTIPSDTVTRVLAVLDAALGQPPVGKSYGA